MPTFDGHLARWFHDHHGIASTRDLSSFGVSARQRQYMQQHGVLELLFEGVYHLVSSPLDFHARCAAVCAADRSLTLSCFTGGALLGLRRCGNPFIHATTLRLTKPLGPGVKIHRSRCLPEEQIVRRDDGIRHTSAERVFFDMARHVGDLTVRSIGEQIIRDGLSSYAQLVGVIEELATRGRPGSRRALRVLASRGDAGGAADSHDEVVLLAALHSVGLTQFVRHPPVRLLSGALVHPDVGDPTIGFYIEVDHHTWHDGMAEVEYDKFRDRQIRLTGAVVERVTDRQIGEHLARVVSEIAALVRARRAQLRR